MPSEPLIIDAPAKINLTLEVLGRRDDGYHEIVSVVQAIDLVDTLVLEESEGVTIHCNIPALATEDNLALQAARLLKQAAGCTKGATIRLEKRIPLASGLGGGSSDAAAVLCGLNRLWELGLTLPDLEGLAAALGSDVPFFIHGGTALIQGRGEKVTPLPSLKASLFLIARPPLELAGKTARVYSLISQRHYTQGEHTQRLVAALTRGEPLQPHHFYSALEGAACLAFPQLEEYTQHLIEAGAKTVHLGGSGPALFSPVSSRDVGTELVARCQKMGIEAYVVSPMRAIA